MKVPSAVAAFLLASVSAWGAETPALLLLRSAAVDCVLPSPRLPEAATVYPPNYYGTTIDGFSVQGSTSFIAATQKALDALAPTVYLREVSLFISTIRQAPCSGMLVQSKTFEAGTPTWSAEVLWYAGAIAHDSRHSRLYAEAKWAAGGKEPAYDTYSGAEAEKKCIAFQLDVLRALGAPEKMISRLTVLMANPTYQSEPPKAPPGQAVQPGCSDPGRWW